MLLPCYQKYILPGVSRGAFGHQNTALYNNDDSLMQHNVVRYDKIWILGFIPKFRNLKGIRLQNGFRLF